MEKEDIKGLSLEELEAKVTIARESLSGLNSKDTAELSVEDTTTWVDEIEASVEEVQELEAEIAVRKETSKRAEAAKAKAEELAAEAEAVKEEAAKAEELAAEEAAKAEEEAAQAKALEEEEAAAKAKAEEELQITPGNSKVPASHTPQVKSEDSTDEKAPVKLLASGNINKVKEGTELDIDALSKAIIHKRHQLSNGAGNGEFVTVASANADWDEDRTLAIDDLAGNEAKIKKHAGLDVIVASGGICAPTEPYYKLEVLSGSDRPVRGALAGFGADRGGINYMQPPSLADLSGSARVTTAAEDAAGYNMGDNSSLVDPKPSVGVSCGEKVEVVVDPISSIVTAGNLAARTYPEQVAAWVKLAAAEHARIAETNLLDKIAGFGTNVTAAKAYGTSRTILANISQAVAGFKSRHRLAKGVGIRVLFPEWVKDAIKTDVLRQAPGDGLGTFAVTDAQIDAWFSTRGVTVSYYIDSATGASQTYGAQGASALIAFPATIKWYMYTEGSLLFLDGGTLDLGLVRDHTLNQQNDFSLFVETFESVAFVGHEVLEVTTTTAPDGTYAPTATATTL